VLPVRCGNREEGLKRVRGEEEKSPACMYGEGAVQGRGEEKRGGLGWGPGLGEKRREEKRREERRSCATRGVKCREGRLEGVGAEEKRRGGACRRGEDGLGGVLGQGLKRGRGPVRYWLKRGVQGMQWFRGEEKRREPCRVCMYGLEACRGEEKREHACGDRRGEKRRRGALGCRRAYRTCMERR